jgi:hypothetical protein
LTLSDVMVLVASTAFGLWLIQPLLGYYAADGRWVFFLRDRWRYPREFVELAVPLLACWTLALLALRLRRPLPGFRRLARQPGTAACGAIVLALTFHAAWILPDSLTPIAGLGHWSEPLIHWYRASNFGWMMSVGPCVAVAWLTLALSGRRRAKPDWIDRSGRILCTGWIVLSLLVCWVHFREHRQSLAREANAARIYLHCAGVHTRCVNPVLCRKRAE